jgi:glycosyltransferase involved in cell wall biosynthesis
MRIILVHNQYRLSGGEDGVVLREKSILEKAGNDVVTYVRSNRDIDDRTALGRIRAMHNTVWSRASKTEFTSILSKFRPDIVHVHNTFATISPSIYFACKEGNVPVVQTLHNYRLVCPAATLFRNGKLCHECVGHSPFRGVLHGCYHKSRGQTAVVSAMLETHKLLGTWQNLIHTYIALTVFAREKFVEGGLPASKIVIKPNFLDVDPGPKQGVGDYALFLGRFSPEKGVSTLSESWEILPRNIPLVCVGDGPLRAELEQRACAAGLTNISFLGQKSQEEVMVLLKGARFLVLPSEWPEQFPLVVVEAFGCGLPVVCSNAPSLDSIVLDGVTGLIFRAADREDLCEKVQFAWEHPDLMFQYGQNARQEYEAKYCASKNLTMLMDIYAAASPAAQCLETAA